MSITQKEVEHIADLARLTFDADALSRFTKDLQNILDLAAQMTAVATKDIQPMAHPLDIVQRLRADVVLETDQREQLQAIAPKVAAGLYLVPQVIEHVTE